MVELSFVTGNSLFCFTIVYYRENLVSAVEVFSEQVILHKECIKRYNLCLFNALLDNFPVNMVISWFSPAFSLKSLIMDLVINHKISVSGCLFTNGRSNN